MKEKLLLTPYTPEELLQLRATEESREYCVHNTHCANCTGDTSCCGQFTNCASYVGQCTGCGSCCDRVLLIGENEIKGMRNWTRRYPRIKRQILEINEGMPHRFCPFFNWRADSHKCLIYHTEAYPFICGAYSCDKKKWNEDLMRGYVLSNRLRRQKMDMYDLWHEIMNDPEDITYGWKLIINLQETYKMSPGPAIWQHPELFNETIPILYEESGIAIPAHIKPK